jgi:hypothetical protein
MVRGICCAWRINTKEREPAILIGTLLALATSGSRGARSEKTGHQDPSVLFLLPGHPVLNPIYPQSCRFIAHSVGTVIRLTVRYTGGEQAEVGAGEAATVGGQRPYRSRVSTSPLQGLTSVSQSESRQCGFLYGNREF